MSTKIKLLVAAVVLAACAAGFYLWLREHDARVTAEARVAQLQQDREQIQKQTTANVQAADLARKQADTPQKQVEYVERYIHTPQPVITPGEAGAPPQITYPDAPSTLKAQADFVHDSVATAAQYDGCKQELGKCDQQKKELESLKNQGFWNRVKRCAAFAATNAGTAAVFSPNSRGRNALIGGGIGVGTCLLVR